MKKFSSFVTVAAFVLAVTQVPTAALALPSAPGSPPLAHPTVRVFSFQRTAVGLTPAKIRKAYSFDTVTEQGEGQTIAIVDAFDAPTIAADLEAFDTQFGITLPKGLPSTPTCHVATSASSCFEKIYTNNHKPRTDSGWATETSLDVEWAHAIAPKANILLVEAQSNSMADLMAAIDLATTQAATVVSMSWGGGEFSQETTFDTHFNHPATSYIASSGDSGNGTSYPAVSPYVLSVGGTTLNLTVGGTIASETAWSGSGGGVSRFETQPLYQRTSITNTKRTIPDVSYDANPSTGFAVYDTTSFQGHTGWMQVGGTSAGAPQVAALLALANQKAPQLSHSVADTYTKKLTFADITSGRNGTCGVICNAAVGYDTVTGLGTPRAAAYVGL